MSPWATIPLSAEHPRGKTNLVITPVYPCRHPFHRHYEANRLNMDCDAGDFLRGSDTGDSVHQDVRAIDCYPCPSWSFWSGNPGEHVVAVVQMALKLISSTTYSIFSHPWYIYFLAYVEALHIQRCMVIMLIHYSQVLPPEGAGNSYRHFLWDITYTCRRVYVFQSVLVFKNQMTQSRCMQLGAYYHPACFLSEILAQWKVGERWIIVFAIPSIQTTLSTF